MRPSSISGKPRPAGPQSPEITPCTVASSLLGLCCLWPSSYSQCASPPNHWPVRVDLLGGRGLSLLLPGCPSLLPPSPGNTTGDGGWDGLQPPPALARTHKEASSILEASRVEERSSSPLLPLPPSAVSQSTIVLAGIYKKLLFRVYNRVSR